MLVDLTYEFREGYHMLKCKQIKGFFIFAKELDKLNVQIAPTLDALVNYGKPKEEWIEVSYALPDNYPWG